MSNKKKVVVVIVGAASAAVAGFLGYMAYLNKKDLDELFTMHDDEFEDDDDLVEDDDLDIEYDDEDEDDENYLSFESEDIEDIDEDENLFSDDPFGCPTPLKVLSHTPFTPLVAPASPKTEGLKREYLNKRAEYRASRKEDQDKYMESLKYMREHSLSADEKASLEFVKKHLASNPSYAQALEYMRVHGDITNPSEKH